MIVAIIPLVISYLNNEFHVTYVLCKELCSIDKCLYIITNHYINHMINFEIMNICEHYSI